MRPSKPSNIYSAKHRATVIAGRGIALPVCPHGTIHGPEILPVKNGYFMRCQMTVIWVPNAVRGSPQLTGDDGPHCSHAAHPSGPPWFRAAEAGAAGRLSSHGPLRATPLLARHAEPGRISRAARCNRLHHRLQTALSEVQGESGNVTFHHLALKIDPLPSNLHDFLSSKPLQHLLFFQYIKSHWLERRHPQIRPILQKLFTKMSGSQVEGNITSYLTQRIQMVYGSFIRLYCHKGTFSPIHHWRASLKCSALSGEAFSGALSISSLRVFDIAPVLQEIEVMQART